MANRTALLSIRIDVAKNGYIVDAEYDTDEPTKERWDRRETEKHIARDDYELVYEVVKPVLEWETQRKQANTGE